MLNSSVLAEERAGTTGYPYAVWLGALKAGEFLAAKAYMGEKAFLKLLEGCASPSQFNLMVETLDEYAVKHAQKTNAFLLLSEKVDDFPYSLGEWIEAWEYLYNWLRQQGRRAEFAAILSYLSCCAEYIANKPVHPSFPDLLEEMLEAYGFAGDTE